MVFVPEGQHDRSQVRSAWGAMQRGNPVPEGGLKALLVPNGTKLRTVCDLLGWRIPRTVNQWFDQRLLVG
jgi:hypothetical protein